MKFGGVELKGFMEGTFVEAKYLEDEYKTTTRGGKITMNLIQRCEPRLADGRQSEERFDYAAHRELPNLTFRATLPGTIQKVTVTGQVSI